MALTEAEKAMCIELGLSMTGHGIGQIAKTASELKYAGFNIYIDNDGSVFEKVGEDLVEVSSPEIEAEKRYLSKINK